MVTTKRKRRRIRVADFDLSTPGGRLAKIRHDAGFVSGSEFARKLDIPASTWLQYENGSRPIPLDLAIPLADRLGFTLDYLYRGVQPLLDIGPIMRTKQR